MNNYPFTKQEIENIVNEYWKDNPPELDRKLIVYTVDTKDGVFKKFEETEQFRKALIKEVNKQQL